MKEVKISIGKEPYSLYIGTNLLEDIDSLLSSHISEKSVFVIIDENVLNYYEEKIIKPLKNNTSKLSYYIVQSGEKNKSIKTYQSIMEKLIDNKYNRNSVIIAIGGGVVGDMAGFVASTYMRGIDIIHIPTTLLAQVDSSIGGKTGINYSRFKNLIGTFYHPKFVVIDTNTLNTLPNREYKAAFGEIIKYGMLADYTILLDLEKNFEEYISRSINLDNIILKCIQIKEEIVMRDETDLGVRKILNLGHTFAHGIESTTEFSKLFHGEAVALGLLIVSKLSFNLKLITEDYYKFIHKLIKKYFNNIFPVSINTDELVNAMVMDKKNKCNDITFILPLGKEKTKVCNNISIETIKNTILEANNEYSCK